MSSRRTKERKDGDESLLGWLATSYSIPAPKSILSVSASAVTFRLNVNFAGFPCKLSVEHLDSKLITSSGCRLDSRQASGKQLCVKMADSPVVSRPASSARFRFREEGEEMHSGCARVSACSGTD